MKTLFIIAWRNIWRHPARSGVLLAAIIVGLCAGILFVGTINGLLDQRVDYLIETEITHAQVHHPQFQAEGFSWMYIEDHDQISSWLNNDPRVQSHTSRTITDGMLRSPIKTSGIRIRGIDVESEIRTTTFHENMVSGEYLDTDMPNAVIIGKSLAESHNLRTGNRLVLTFEDTQNQLTSGAFNISGKFESASTDYDEHNVFVRSNDLIEILAEKPVYHEIGIMLTHVDQADSVVADLNSNFDGINAQTWRQLSPELNMIVEMGDFMMFLITIIIMTALAFGILNTMLMALFERMREIGMLLSIGMSRLRVFLMIMLESVLLTAAGAAAGMVLAIISIHLLSETGINFEMFAEGVAEIGFDYIIYPVLSTNDYIGIGAVVITITILASLYPAIRAIRIDPLEAAKDA